MTTEKQGHTVSIETARRFANALRIALYDKRLERSQSIIYYYDADIVLRMILGAQQFRYDIRPVKKRTHRTYVGAVGKLGQQRIEPHLRQLIMREKRHELWNYRFADTHAYYYLTAEKTVRRIGQACEPARALRARENPRPLKNAFDVYLSDRRPVWTIELTGNILIAIDREAAAAVSLCLLDVSAVQSLPDSPFAVAHLERPPQEVLDLLPKVA